MSKAPSERPRTVESALPEEDGAPVRPAGGPHRSVLCPSRPQAPPSAPHLSPRERLTALNTADAEFRAWSRQPRGSGTQQPRLRLRAGTRPSLPPWESIADAAPPELRESSARLAQLAAVRAPRAADAERERARYHLNAVAAGRLLMGVLGALRAAWVLAIDTGVPPRRCNR
jgi:hypothetical protein